MKIEAEHRQWAPANLIGFLSAREIPVTSLQNWEQNLESIFPQLTGNKLRK